MLNCGSTWIRRFFVGAALEAHARVTVRAAEWSPWGDSFRDLRELTAVERFLDAAGGQ